MMESGVSTEALESNKYGISRRIIVILAFTLALMMFTVLLVAIVCGFSSVTGRESYRFEGEFSSYSGVLSQNPRFGSGNYECTGSCFCGDEDEIEYSERRTATTLKTGLVFGVAALSTFMAMGYAKNAFNQECKDQFYKECPAHLIESDVECVEVETKEEEEESAASIEEKFEIEAVGIIHTPYKEKKGMPVAQVGAKKDGAVIAIFPEYVPAIQDMEGFSHVYVTFMFHQIQKTLLQVAPIFDKDNERGIFSTRAPMRPNRLGLSLCRIVKVVGNEIHVDGIDAVDGTPVVDLKPYIPQFETDMSKEDVDTGWFDATKDKVEQKKFRSKVTGDWDY